MILIAGGTGRLGTLLIERLVNQRRQVRIMTRDPARAAHLVGGHVQVVTGDVRDRASLDPACSGVDVVVSAVHGFTGGRGNSPAEVDRDGNANLIDAARSAGADFVLISTVGAAHDSPMELFRMKHAAEQSAFAGGIPTTVVRATAFLELWVEILQQTAARSGRPVVFGHGNNPINFVSVGDVAALVAHAATDPVTRGKTLEIGGPDNITLKQLAEAVQTAAGRAGAPRHVPTAILHVMANTVGRIKPRLGRQARAAMVMDRVDLSFEAAPLHRIYPDLPSTALSDLLARRPPLSATIPTAI